MFGAGDLHQTPEEHIVENYHATEKYVMNHCNRAESDGVYGLTQSSVKSKEKPL